MARDGPGAARRIGDADARAQALGGEPRDDIAGERRLPAEEVGAAGDVEHDARGRVDPDQRGVAVAPSAIASSSPWSAAGSLGATSSAGWRARASASAVPTVRPRRAAASFIAAIRSALLTMWATTSARSGSSGAAARRRVRRSVGSRRSQIER